MPLSLEESFNSLEDPRVNRNKKHLLLDIIILTLCAVISGAEGWESIEQFGEEKQQGTPIIAKIIWAQFIGLACGN